MTREEKVVLYVVNVLDGMRQKGLITGGHELSDKGRQEIIRMKAEGFRPTPDEVRDATIALLNSADEKEGKSAG